MKRPNLPSFKNAVRLLLLSLALSATGCSSLIEGAWDQWDYNQRVDQYRDRGFSKKEAERNAYEDQFFDR